MMVPEISPAVPDEAVRGIALDAETEGETGEIAVPISVYPSQKTALM